MFGFPSRDSNYTGIWTRSLVYSGTLVVFLAALGMTLASIIVPRWVSYENDTPTGDHIRYTYGLHKRCSSLTGLCTHFPQYEDCHGEDRYFCSMWRSVGFLMSFAIVLQGMTIVAYITVILGGKQRREKGWSVLASLIVISAVMQCASMSLIAYLYDNDERFFVGWKLDDSWILCTISWAISILCAVAVSTAALVLPSEGGYELIPDPAYGG